MPFDAAWTRRVKITSKATQIPAAFGHCLLFDCNANLAGVSDFWNNIKSDGSDIRVTKADGETEVARGVRNFNVGSEIGHIYLRHPDISTSADVDMYLYFGNAAASDYADSNALGYQGTWAGESAIEIHYPCDSADISGSSLLDQSGNARPGTLVNQAAGNASGKIGGCIAFDGTGDTITRANASNIIIPASNAAWTFQGWLNCTSVTGATTVRMFLAADSYQVSGFRCGVSGGDWGGPQTLRCDSQENAGTITCEGAAITMAAWHFITFSYSGSSAFIALNGNTSYGTDASGTILSNTVTITFGGGVGGQRQWLGYMDDLRIFSRALTANEHTTVYNNHNANSSFWDAGSVELTAPNYTQTKFQVFNDDGTGL